MKILIIHQFFPGQFRSLVYHLATNRLCQIVAIGQECQISIPLDKVIFKVYKPKNHSTTSLPLYLSRFDRAVQNGQAVTRVLEWLKSRGFKPDIALAHIGWGEALYFKDIFPKTPLLAYCEFYYHAQGADAGFDPASPITQDDALRIRTQNAPLLLSLTAMDYGISPTPWQRSLFPPEYQNKIEVLHEGVDTAKVTPDPQARLTLPDGRVVRPGQEIVTYAARNLEPYRGFPSFMRAAAEICRRRPRCLILVEGGDGVSYSPRLPRGQTYRERMLKEVPIDPERVIFLGHLPFSEHLRLLQVSAVHIYLTVPFVLSWSLLEAMAARNVVIASDTAPVRDVIEDGKNGLLVDFFSPRKIADRVDEVLDHPNHMAAVSGAAREHIRRHYEVKNSLARYQEIITKLVNQQSPFRQEG
ncbi:MAG TPA: glycosyltransferase family 4 protein [Candidatus Competibacteraceae bacterium]|nr:glycosyltransferase family 4 protein [Candidatus Competibacteraceae bacterium]